MPSPLNGGGGFIIHIGDYKMSLTNHGCIKINGANEFSPKSCKITWESLSSEDSGRTADGVMHNTFIRGKIRKLEITLKPCTPSYASAIMNLVQGQQYSITYFDGLANQEVTMTVYTSGSSGDCYSGVIGGNGLWQDVSFSAIEV